MGILNPERNFRIDIGDDQNKVKRPLYQGFANTPVLCISVSVLRDLHWLPLVISRFPSTTIVYFTFPIDRLGVFMFQI